MEDLFGSSGAVFSDDRTERYELYIDLGAGERGSLLFVGINPSVADGDDIIDATVTRMLRRAAKWRFRRLLVGNLHPIVDPDMARFLRSANPLGDRQRNEDAILRMARTADLVVLGFGAQGNRFGQAARITQLLLRNQIALHCLRLTKDGMPEHPLYLSYDTPVMPFAPPAHLLEINAQGTQPL